MDMEGVGMDTDTGQECMSEEGADIIEVVEDDFISKYHTFLMQLQQHLTFHHWNSRTEREATQISVKVSKYLTFCGPPFSQQHLYDPSKLNQYQKRQEKEGKKASTQHAILCRIKQGLALA